MSEHDFWVTIRGDRGEEWKRVIGTAYVPVQSPIPIRANLPGLGEQSAFLLAMDQLRAEQLHKIIAHLCEKFHLPRVEGEHEIRAAGIPIWDHDCTLTILRPQRWFG